MVFTISVGKSRPSRGVAMQLKWIALCFLLGFIVILDPSHTPAQFGKRGEVGGKGGGEFGKGGKGMKGDRAQFGGGSFGGNGFGGRGNFPPGGIAPAPIAPVD